MKLTRYHLAGLAAAAVSATPALAQDYDEPSFGGFYVGAAGGYDFQDNDLGSRINFDRNGDGTFENVTTAAGANAFSPGFCNSRARGATPAATCENDRNRFSYYGRVGYDIQRGRLVIGAIGEFGKTDIVDYVSAFSTTPASYTMSREVDWEGSARLRAGYAMQNGMFYATGGAGYARIKHGFATTNTANTFTAIEDDQDKFGFIVGGGAEVKVFGPFTLGLEYTYHDYKDGQYKVYATRGSAPATNPFVLPPNTAGTVFERSDDNFRWHSIRATVGFHF